jgi:hypothetical protein
MHQSSHLNPTNTVDELLILRVALLCLLCFVLLDPLAEVKQLPRWDVDHRNMDIILHLGRYDLDPLGVQVEAFDTQAVARITLDDKLNGQFFVVVFGRPYG